MLEVCAADNRSTVPGSASRGWSRRRMLSAGTLALGGLTLPDLFRADLQAGPTQGKLTTGKAVIFVFQQGGPSQFETFDPKPEAPSRIRTLTETIPTRVPGLFFGSTFERLAQLADKLTIVRSFATGNAGHNIRPLVGPESQETYLGAYYARIAGATDPVTALPSSAVLFPQAVCDDVTRGSGRGDLAATGGLGSAYAPFMPGGKWDLLKNLTLNLGADRFENRQQLRYQLDQYAEHFSAESQLQAVAENQRQAAEVLLSGRVADALDLSQESPELLARYDTTRFAARDNWKKSGRGKRGYYTGHAKSFGKALLLARRLCEAGGGFVTVHCDYEGVWDMHADGNNLNMLEGMEAVGRSFDHAMATLIEDLEDRGLANQILVIATGEMGRTPVVNRNGGRDHWSKLAPLMLYGGGQGRGQVIGQSTRDGGEPADNPCNSQNLISTVLHTVLDPGLVRLEPGLRNISALEEPTPIGL